MHELPARRGCILTLCECGCGVSLRWFWSRFGERSVCSLQFEECVFGFLFCMFYIYRSDQLMLALLDVFIYYQASLKQDEIFHFSLLLVL